MENNQNFNDEPKKGISVKTLDIAVALCFLFVGAFVIYDSLKIGITWESDGPKGGYFPFYLGLIFSIASVINLIKALLGHKTYGTNAVDYESLKRVATVFVPALLYVLGIKYIGIYIASWLYMTLFMKYMGHYRWHKSVLISLGVVISMYLIFDAWFKIPLPRGQYDFLLFLRL